MIASDTVQLAIRNLGEAKLRTSLTTLGVAIGIASLAGMVSLGVGLQDQLVGRLMSAGVFDAVTVMPQPAFLGARGRGGFGARGGFAGRSPTPAGETPQRLDDEALKKIAAIPNVIDVYPNVRVPIEIRRGEFSELTVALGVPMSSRGQGAFQSITYGSFFPSAAGTDCMLSLDLAKRIDENAPRSLVGQFLTLETVVGRSGIPIAPADRTEEQLKIVGIIDRQAGIGLAIGGGQADVMLPIAVAKSLDITGREAPAVTVKVSRAEAAEDVENQIKRMGFVAVSLSDALQGAKRAFILLDIALSLIGSIALAVSSLGIVNTMVMSILERTREIGIMKAIGGSDADIRRIFLVEAAVIGLMGGGAGVAIGWAVGRVINFGANLYIQSQGGTAGNLFALPWWLIGGSIGFAVVVSLVAGSFPAARAARLDPIQALRHD